MLAPSSTRWVVGLPRCNPVFLHCDQPSSSLPYLEGGIGGKGKLEAPGSDPLDPNAFLSDFNRSDLSVFVHQGSVRPLGAALTITVTVGQICITIGVPLTLLFIVCNDHPWFEGLEHRHLVVIIALMLLYIQLEYAIKRNIHLKWNISQGNPPPK